MHVSQEIKFPVFKFTINPIHLWLSMQKWFLEHINCTSLFCQITSRTDKVVWHFLYEEAVSDCQYHQTWSITAQISALGLLIFLFLVVLGRFSPWKKKKKDREVISLQLLSAMHEENISAKWELFNTYGTVRTNGWKIKLGKFS